MLGTYGRSVHKKSEKTLPGYLKKDYLWQVWSLPPCLLHKIENVRLGLYLAADSIPAPGPRRGRAVDPTVVVLQRGWHIWVLDPLPLVPIVDVEASVASWISDAPSENDKVFVQFHSAMSMCRVGKIRPTGKATLLLSELFVIVPSNLNPPVINVNNLVFCKAASYGYLYSTTR